MKIIEKTRCPHAKKRHKKGIKKGSKKADNYTERNKMLLSLSHPLRQVEGIEKAFEIQNYKKKYTVQVESIETVSNITKQKYGLWMGWGH